MSKQLNMGKTAHVVKEAFEAGILKHRWFGVKGLTLHAVATNHPSAASSMPLVLVHGLGVSSRYMLPTALRLAPDYPVYALDLPGFGQSANPTHILNISELAEVLASFVEVMGLNQNGVIFLANSLGCQIVADLAVRYPTLIKCAILTGPTFDPLRRGSALEILRLLRDVPDESFNQLHLALSDYWRCGPRRMWQTFQYAMHDPIEEKLPLIQVPVLVVRGEQDTIAAQPWVEQMAKLLPHAELVVIPHAPHAVPNKAAPQLADLTRAFVAKMASTTPSEVVIPNPVS